MVLQRHEINEKDTWDLSTIYPTDQAWEEALKDLTRTNKQMNAQVIAEFVSGLNVNDDIKEELLAISPSSYTGI